MGLDPEYIRRNINRFGKKEARTLLSELITSSEDMEKRREALKIYITLDEGKDFRFYEQLFLTDEDETIRYKAGVCLKENYILNKKLLVLLRFILFEYISPDVTSKLFAIELLNRINKKRTRNILKDYLGKLLDSHSEDKRSEILTTLKDSKFDSTLSSQILDILINLTLAEYYEQIRHYNITLMGGVIIQLNCEGASLSSILDIEGIKCLSHLVHLNLHRNQIKEISKVNYLKELRTLILSENLIERMDNYEEIQNLRELVLTSNQIKEIVPTGLEKLTKLSLDRNQISEIKNLEGLKNLEVLNLSHNNIKEIKGLYPLINLRNLNLSFNSISRISGLDSLRKLQILYLSNNNIEEITGLDNLFELKVLTLSNNKIGQIKNLTNLINLKKLEISDNRIMKINGLDNQVNLQELFLDRNLVKRIEGLETLRSLIILFLERNQIESFKPDDIRHLGNLNFIFLNENPLNAESRKFYDKKTRFP